MALSAAHVHPVAQVTATCDSKLGSPDSSWVPPPPQLILLQKLLFWPLGLDPWASGLLLRFFLPRGPDNTLLLNSRCESLLTSRRWRGWPGGGLPEMKPLQSLPPPPPPLPSSEGLSQTHSLLCETASRWKGPPLALLAITGLQVFLLRSRDSAQNSLWKQGRRSVPSVKETSCFILTLITGSLPVGLIKVLFSPYNREGRTSVLATMPGTVCRLADSVPMQFFLGFMEHSFFFFFLMF